MNVRISLILFPFVFFTKATSQSYKTVQVHWAVHRLHLLCPQNMGNGNDVMILSQIARDFLHSIQKHGAHGQRRGTEMYRSVPIFLAQQSFSTVTVKSKECKQPGRPL